VRVADGDASRGWAEGAPYDAILVSAGASELPLVLLEQLEPGGRLVIPLGDDSGQLLERFQQRADSLESETIGACQLDMWVCPRRRTLSNFPWTGRPGAK
jgi:protein-L-isoaspartate(D-aspartate) O-methyltransferase